MSWDLEILTTVPVDPEILQVVNRECGISTRFKLEE